MKKTHKEELYIKQDNLTDQLFDTHSIFLISRQLDSHQTVLLFT